MTAKERRAMETENAMRELMLRGYEQVKKEDRHGETKSGWWCDDVFLSKDPIQALREADGHGQT